MKSYKLFFQQLTDDEFLVLYKSLTNQSEDNFYGISRETFESMRFWSEIENETRSEKKFEKEIDN
jgi:hypothetical protein